MVLWRRSARLPISSVESEYFTVEDLKATTTNTKTTAAAALCFYDHHDRHPTVLVLVPSLELGVQVSMVAKQLAQAIRSDRGPISVHNARRGWPQEVPDILVCTPRAAAQGLEPCTSEDEMARRQALKRIKDVELVVFDEADLLFDRGNQGNDTQTVLTAIAASFPDRPRLVQPEAQVYRPDGIPVEVLTSSRGYHQWKQLASFRAKSMKLPILLAVEALHGRYATLQAQTAREQSFNRKLFLRGCGNW
ncbi:hypothetical protein AK812_SmicGene44901 [Symbiodinium microadriaticum]|uniref:Helicase ATP-binding domain-containing protein n=1 Tax=Symbiodinium microadriaticum TaxID=2951 RepID=A0A1Q9BX93_SYMMI|nr:hypothetical protein AK812_SmicGene44901 [Symbiodinium microadriaticum]